MVGKTLILRVARHAGLFSLVRATRWRQSRLLILGYHGVSMLDEHEWDPELYMTADLLRARLRLLRERGYVFVRLGAALRQLREGTLPRDAVCVTFDDGALDFAERALPVLRELQVPATLYLSTYYCLHRLPVFDTALGYLLWKGRDCTHAPASPLPGGGPLEVRTPEARERTWQALHAHALRERLGALDKHALLRRVADALGIDFDAFVASRLLQLMTPEQVRALPRDLVDVQLHTHRHRTPRDEAAFKRELRDNQASVAQLTGEPGQCRHFCYPSGDYDGEFLGWLQDEGIESATTCVPGLAARDSDPLLLPRFIDTTSTSAIALEAWASGIAELLPRRAAYRLDAARLRRRDGAARGARASANPPG